MNEQKLLDVIYDTKMYILNHVKEFEGELTDDEHDALAELMDLCAEAKQISYGKIKLRQLKKRLDREMEGA